MPGLESWLDFSNYLWITLRTLSNPHLSSYIPSAPNSKWLFPVVMKHVSAKPQKRKICSSPDVCDRNCMWGVRLGSVSGVTIREGRGRPESKRREDVSKALQSEDMNSLVCYEIFFFFEPKKRGILKKSTSRENLSFGWATFHACSYLYVRLWKMKS